MFANRELRRGIMFAKGDWEGGMYGSAGMAGSRPGNVIAGTWASIVS